MPRTSFGKTRPKDNPYAVYEDVLGGWEWRVVKTYQHPSAEKNNGYARWNVYVKSPFTMGSYEGPSDMYCREIKDNGLVDLVSADDKWLEEYGDQNA